MTPFFLIHPNTNVLKSTGPEGVLHIEGTQTMRALAFLDDTRHFDGGCVRFYGHDGEQRVVCGITTAALKEHDEYLPRHGLLPAELFLEAFDRHQIAIHDAARRKYACGECEPEGEMVVLLHRRDLG